MNQLAWEYYAKGYSNILGLGPDASEQTVVATMCSVSPPHPEIESAALLAATYYGWSFASDPVFDQWDGQQCP